MVCPFRAKQQQKKKKTYKVHFSLSSFKLFNTSSLLPILVGMAATHVEVNAQPHDEVDLTDDQIQELLLEAEGRLRGSDVQLTPDSDVASLRYI